MVLAKVGVYIICALVILFLELCIIRNTKRDYLKTLALLSSLLPNSFASHYTYQILSLLVPYRTSSQ